MPLTTGHVMKDFPPPFCQMSLICRVAMTLLKGMNRVFCPNPKQTLPKGHWLVQLLLIVLNTMHNIPRLASLYFFIEKEVKTLLPIASDGKNSQLCSRISHLNPCCFLRQPQLLS